MHKRILRGKGFFIAVKISVKYTKIRRKSDYVLKESGNGSL